VATLALAAGLLVAGALAARTAWRRSAGAPAAPVPRPVPGPVPALVAVLAAVLALQVLGLARTAVEHRDSYTPASDALATLAGRPCGLQERLSVETDPAAGLLTARGVPVDVGGTTLPGLAVAGDVTTDWAALDPDRRDLPVVVTVTGTMRPGDTAAVEWGDDRGAVLGRVALTAEGEPRDVRLPVPDGAAAVRLTVTGAAGDDPALVTLPRVPVLTRMTDLLPPGTTAVLDWPVAFVFPCLAPAPLALGTADLATWRIAPPADDPAAGITYAPGFGGPFAAPRLLVTEQRMATYLDGDPLRDAAQVVRWTPVQPLARPGPMISGDTVPGWARDGDARVPGLDAVG
jgi:arabinosyltransferase A/arabinosyltransferase B/arabinosyltransferase C